MKYKINLHAHTFFSDGRNSPYKMALKAKELDFTSLVLTDHWYPVSDKSLTNDKYQSFMYAVSEAKRILPIIIGLEIPVAETKEEILIFGHQAINAIIKYGNRSYNLDMIKNIKSNTHCAMILCHPRECPDRLANIVDGFEAYNSGSDFFRMRGFGNLANLPAWSNSDAHFDDGMYFGHNKVDTKITTEDNLIKYIKSGKQPYLYAMGNRL